jgi:DNA repair protein RadC
VDHIDATLHRHRSPVEHRHAGTATERLSLVDCRNQPDDALGARPTNLFLSKADPQTRCRTVLEQILAPIIGNRARSIADRLVDEFGSLNATLAARPAHLARIVPDEDVACRMLKTTATALEYCLRSKAEATRLTVSLEEAMAFLQFRIGYSPVEVFYALYFNNESRLIYDGPVAQGGATSCEVNLRPVILTAIEIGAVGVVLSHNHPSGDPTPSRPDIALTHDMRHSVKFLGLSIFDHIVVSGNKGESMRQKNLF